MLRGSVDQCGKGNKWRGTTLEARCTNKDLEHGTQKDDPLEKVTDLGRKLRNDGVPLFINYMRKFCDRWFVGRTYKKFLTGDTLRLHYRVQPVNAM
jgi:hypothetical protein